MFNNISKTLFMAIQLHHTADFEGASLTESSDQSLETDQKGNVYVIMLTQSH